MAAISLFAHPFCLETLLCKKVTFISYVVNWLRSYADENITAVLPTSSIRAQEVSGSLCQSPAIPILTVKGFTAERTPRATEKPSALNHSHTKDKTLKIRGVLQKRASRRYCQCPVCLKAEHLKRGWCFHVVILHPLSLTGKKN